MFIIFQKSLLFKLRKYYFIKIKIKMYNLTPRPTRRPRHTEDRATPKASKYINEINLTKHRQS